MRDRFGAVHGQSFTYDAARSRVARVSDEVGGQSADFAYDPGSDLVSGLTWRGGSGQKVGGMEQRWDNLDRLVSVAVRDGRGGLASRFGYGHDAQGRRTQAVLEDATSWSYGYDSLGQVTSGQRRLADGRTPLAGRTYGYGFDGIGNNPG